VAILDPGGERGQAWQASAGMLAPQIEGRQGDLLFDLGLAGRELYCELAGVLKDDTGVDIELWRGGSAAVALEEAEAAGFARWIRYASSGAPVPACGSLHHHRPSRCRNPGRIARRPSPPRPYAPAGFPVMISRNRAAVPGATIVSAR
jgi:hypothetical protein